MVLDQQAQGFSVMTRICVGIAGIFGSNKTRLAETFVQEHPSFTLIPNRFREIEEKLGYSMQFDNLTYNQIIELQSAIVDAHESDVAKVEGDYITDGTIIDCLTQALRFSQAFKSKEANDLFEKFAIRCFKLSSIYDIIAVMPVIFTNGKTDNTAIKMSYSLILSSVLDLSVVDCAIASIPIEADTVETQSLCLNKIVEAVSKRKSGISERNANMLLNALRGALGDDALGEQAPTIN